MSHPSSLAIKNVHVFTGIDFTPLTTVFIDGENIATERLGAPEMDGNGGFLIPGLIDAHLHMRSSDGLDQLAKVGVTAAIDLGCWPTSLVQALKEYSTKPGVTQLQSAGLVATAPNSLHEKMFPDMPKSAILSSPSQAERFVTERLAEGADYIKIIADIPGPDQETINALVKSARVHGKLSIIHATKSKVFDMAVKAGPDVITHVPLDAALSESAIEQLLEKKIVCIPTLTMARALTSIRKTPGMSYENCQESVTRLVAAGVSVLAGTDANDHSPAGVAFGKSLHDELANFVVAGMSPLAALRSATVESAAYFGFDSGIIEPGRPANLVLLGKNPLEDIKATRDIRAVWCQGTQVAVQDLAV
ncbi:hypothetical protein NQ176_g2274 [Zarea fungicola]|uniref:Uncharacterized protein n=1 Tax=Zarea fungicola TaxID=93591 RepID=A0ACC1NPP8_9HYPO|nr:hypothetical protein NQ176_g2274 [Lecanicillium fungicola]